MGFWRACQVAMAEYTAASVHISMQKQTLKMERALNFHNNRVPSHVPNLVRLDDHDGKCTVRCHRCNANWRVSSAAGAAIQQGSMMDSLGLG